MKKAVYITTTLPYVNAPLHMGHALEFIRADAIARHMKLLGYDVFFNTGTDEHGQKIYTKALAAGKDPQIFVDEAFNVFKSQVEVFGISDGAHFIRTTDEHHVKAAQEFWKRVSDNGYIYKKSYQAKYCVGCESEKTDSELVNGECPLHPGVKIELIDEENYFFKLSAFQDKLLAFFEANPDFIVPQFRYNEMKAFVARGLEDFSISRLKEKMSWGVPVPGDDDQVIYVWFDALSNYISTLGWPQDLETFNKYWKDGSPIQYCGKDNTRFQGVIWQAMLLAAELPNSHNIVVNGFITGEGGIRMSKTLGNVVDPLEMVREYGTDALRMFLLTEVSSFEDSPFTIERFKDAYNANLANGLGNLASRILTLSEKYIEPITEAPVYSNVIENFDIQKTMEHIRGTISELDKYINDTKPFSIIKTDEEAGKEIIRECVKRLASITVSLQPFIPETSAKIEQLIKQNKKPVTPLFLRKD